MIKNSYLKDLIVIALAFLGGLSDFNSFDIPYWMYGILLFAYILLRATGKKVKVKDFVDEFHDNLEKGK